MTDPLDRLKTALADRYSIERELGHGGMVTVYHAQPLAHRDPLRRLVEPDLFVDVSEVIERKVEMLSKHGSQKKWLDESQGRDSYLQTLEWADCGNVGSRAAECATATVPIDYDDPSGGTTYLELKRLPALGEKQGSLFINRTLPRALASLRDDGLKIEIRHQAGVRWAEVVRTAYQDLKIEAKVTAFLAQPWQAFAEADLIVARSGALTISELASAGRGALLIPFAAAAGNHQEFNARSLERAGGALVLTEHEAMPLRVAMLLGKLLRDHETLVDMGRRAREVALPDAAARIAERVLAIGGGE